MNESKNRFLWSTKISHRKIFQNRKQKKKNFLQTAEELALWDKQKRWQQTAEKFKERLRVKTEDYEKLETSNKKLRAVVSCMEREKWYLRSKLRCENGCLVGSLSARPGTLGHTDVLENLQRECLTLRSRVRELTDRLEEADMEQLVMKIESQGRKILALETTTKVIHVFLYLFSFFKSMMEFLHRSGK